VTAGTFNYANPRTIHWGPGSLPQRLRAELERHGVERAFVISTRSVVSNEALLGTLRDALGARCLGVFGAIGQHAPASSVAAAVEAAREVRPDAVVSFGGGSPIDAAKSVAFALATGLDLRDPRAAANARSYHPTELIPHFAVPTTLSAAELSGLAGFTTEAEHEKVGLRGEALIPTAVFYDAELCVHTPLDLWLSTGIRAVDHAVETILADGNHPLPDTLALDALERLNASLRATCNDPGDLDARTESQLGAWFSFALPGPAAGGLSHTLGKRIGSRHGIPHGVSSCLVLPHVMRYLTPRKPLAMARIAAALSATNAADAVAGLIADLHLPTHLADYRLTEDDLVEAARPVASDAYPLDDLINIFRAAM
jgi:alcohol dehydrogenase class IV